MIYIQLRVPVREFTKVRIKEISFYDTNGEDNLDKALGFKYQVYRKDGDKYISLYEHRINITDQDYIKTICNSNNDKLSSYDTICKSLLQFLVDGKIETGTVEFE